jgi:hypothetical protein
MKCLEKEAEANKKGMAGFEPPSSGFLWFKTCFLTEENCLNTALSSNL